MAHFLSSFPILSEYTQLGNVSRNVQNLLVLGNPHLLKYPPPNIQANFVSNLFKVHRKNLFREEKSSLFTHLDSINEENEELGSLGGKIEDEKLQLDRYIKVLQIKRKEIDSGKKSSDLPASTVNTLVWPMDAPSAEKTYLVTKVQDPSAKPLLRTPKSVEPACHDPFPKLSPTQPLPHPLCQVDTTDLV